MRLHIFAAGDVTGRLLLVPPAIQDGFVAATNAVRGPTMTLNEAVNPIGSFTDPEYAQVGLTEAQARAAHDIVVSTIHFDSTTTRTIIDGRTFGFCKLIVDRETHKILGCHVVGERAVEITQVAAIAITAGMRVDELASRSAFVSDVCRNSWPRGGKPDTATQPARSLANKLKLTSTIRPSKGNAMATAARTYNQDHVARKYTPGKRRVSIYWTWSYPWETNRDVTELDNRFSTMTEVRRVAWPDFEATEWDKMNFLQGIAGTLELFHRSSLSFQQIVGEATGHPVAVFQRIDQAGYKLPIDERVLADTDTLLVFGLDHLVAEQEAEPAEIEAIREWLKREGTCLLLAPHHDVGFTDDSKQRQMEYRHHGDELVPRQQRFSQYTRSLMKALNVPVLNQWGLRPAVVKGTKEIAPLTAFRDLDKVGLLNNVTTFNFHLHLPHYEVTTQDAKSVQVLGAAAHRPRSPASLHGRRKQRIQLPAAGCRRTNNEPVTSCSSTPPTSRRSSAARIAWRTFGEIWR